MIILLMLWVCSDESQSGRLGGDATRLLAALLAPLAVCFGQLAASLGERVARDGNTLSGSVAVALIPFGRGDNQTAVRAHERELPARSGRRERLSQRSSFDRLSLEVLRSAEIEKRGSCMQS